MSNNVQKLLKAQEKLEKVNGGQTDERTDRPTDRVTYRVACTRLKTKLTYDRPCRRGRKH